MSSTRGVNFGEGRDPVNLFGLKQGETFTLPRTVTAVSPTSALLAQSLDTVRDTVGGQIIFGKNDGTGGAPGGTFFIGTDLHPGDVVAVSAVVSNVATVTVNAVPVFRITGVTTVATITGFFA